MYVGSKAGRSAHFDACEACVHVSIQGDMSFVRIAP